MTVELQLQSILDFVAVHRGVDFRDYRRETLRNRIESRMRSAGSAGLEDYRARLLADPAEVQRLVAALVVPVTSFFRDREVFEALASQVLPALPGANLFLRAWVAGAATGEEAYSVAILLAELTVSRRGAGFHVLATDIDAALVETARRAVYPEALTGVPAGSRSRYFTVERGGLRVNDALRGQVTVVQHDLVGPLLAPPEAIVASFELVCCRNVLMYFDPPLRARALDRLAAVLQPGGALVLGTAEPLPEGAPAELEPWPGVASGLGIFRRGATP